MVKARRTQETVVEVAAKAIEAATDSTKKSSTAANLVFALPPINPLPKEDPEEEQALQQQANDAEEWMLSALTWLHSYEGTTQLYKSTHPGLESTAKVYQGTKVALLDDGNETDVSRLARRRGAWIGLLRFEFSRDLKTQENVRSLLDRLVKQGSLTEEALSGPFNAYGRTFSLPQSVGFNPQTDAERIDRTREALKELLERVRRERIARTAEKARGLRDQSKLTLDQLLAGNPGMHCLDFWPEEEIHDDRTVWHAGGTLLVKSDGQRIFPVDAAGLIENDVKELVERKRFLLFYAIGWSKPPDVNPEDPELNRDVKRLWHWIRRGVLSGRMKNKATISPESFFSGEAGISLLRFKGVWSLNTSVNTQEAKPNVFFLIERKSGENGTPLLRIAEVSPRLDGFFAQCMDEYPDEDNFSNCPYPLGPLLRKIKKQVVGEPAKVSEAGNDNSK